MHLLGGQSHKLESTANIPFVDDNVSKLRFGEVSDLPAIRLDECGDLFEAVFDIRPTA